MVSVVLRGGSELSYHGQVVVICSLVGRHRGHQSMEELYITYKLQHQTCRNKGLRKNRTQTEEIQKLKMQRIQDGGNVSQPCGLFTDGPVDH